MDKGDFALIFISSQNLLYLLQLLFSWVKYAFAIFVSELCICGIALNSCIIQSKISIIGFNESGNWINFDGNSQKIFRQRASQTSCVRSLERDENLKLWIEIYALGNSVPFTNWSILTTIAKTKMNTSISRLNLDSSYS